MPRGSRRCRSSDWVTLGALGRSFGVPARTVSTVFAEIGLTEGSRATAGAVNRGLAHVAPVPFMKPRWRRGQVTAILTNTGLVPVSRDEVGAARYARGVAANARTVMQLEDSGCEEAAHLFLQRCTPAARSMIESWIDDHQGELRRVSRESITAVPRYLRGYLGEIAVVEADLQATAS